MKSNILGALVLVLALTLLVLPTADAGGTKAGSTIRNVATLTYFAGGGGSQLSVADSVDVTVETLVGVNVAYTAAPITTIGDGTRQEIAITVTNTGNGTDNYNLAYTVPTGWDTAYQDSIYADLNGDGVLDPNEWVSGNVVSASGNLNGWTYDETGAAATEETYSFIVVTYSTQYLTANTTHVDSVQVDGTTSPTVGNVAEGSQSTTWTIQRANFTVTSKAIDTTFANGYGKEAGSTIKYTLTLTAESGTNLIDATNVVVRDTLDANLTYGAVVGTPQGSVGEASGVVTWTVGTVTGGSSVTLEFTASINSGVAAGTNVLNDANIAYDDANINSEWTRDATTNTVTFTVIGFGWSIAISDSAATPSFVSAINSETVEPNQTIWYLLRLTNNGSVSDQATLSFTSAAENAGASSANWTWSFYLDGGDLAAGNDGGTLTMNYTTASTSAGNSVYIWAAYAPEYNAPYNAFDSTKYIATSVGNSSAKDTAISVTNVNAPFIQLTKAVFGDASGSMGSTITTAAPGDTLWYRVYFINSGDAPASTVTLTDAIPTNTTYLSTTVETSPDGSAWTGKTDSAGDGVTASQGAGVSYTIGSLAASTDGYIRFRVVVN
jgi:uncharacterized repeat protein (TIGR01451 family)/fimbrial isopeptide formation D2 family protein